MTTTTTATAIAVIATDSSGCDDDGDGGNAYLCAVHIVWRRTAHETVYSANAISLGQSILSFDQNFNIETDFHNGHEKLLHFFPIVA